VSPAAFRRITLAVLATQVLIVLTGAAVRLTGSGLGCSNWPNCTDERLVAPAEYNAVIEFVNRLVSFPVLVAVLLAVWAARRRDPQRRELVILPIALLVGVVIQILLGAVVVRMELLPSTVIVHFLVSMVLIGLAVTLHHRADPSFDHAIPALPGAAARGASPARVLTWALVVGAAAVLVTGTVVTGSGPHGGDDAAERLDFFLPTVARVHSLTVWGFLALLVVTLLVVRADGAPRHVLRAGSVVLATSLAQGAVGYLQYWNGVPEGLVFLHIIGAMAVWGTTLWFCLEERRLEATRPGPSARRAGAPTVTAGGVR
jgi:heme a synthase